MEKNDQTELAKGRVTEALMKSWGDARWKPLLEKLGLNDDEMVDRLVRLLLIHLVMDRTVTTVLTVKLANHDIKAFDETEAELARLNLSNRIPLAKASDAISDSCAKDMLEVNAVRNKFSHYNPKLEGGLANVKEIASNEDFEKLVMKAIGGIEEMGKRLGIIKKA